MQELYDPPGKVRRDNATMLRGVQLVLREGRHAGAVKKAVVRKRTMIGGGELKLPDAVALGVRVDPEEEVLSRANANGDLIFRRTSKRRVDDVNVADSHKTP
ncbi:MAG: hypothetical protein M9924_06180 [Rhizobiaceae bacterium]|nr:hypothetical protein [Rhizobiaceae bacterium]